MILRRIPTPLHVVKSFKWNHEKAFESLGEGVVAVGNFLLYRGELLESISAKSLFRMEGQMWGLLGSVNENKIRMVRLGSDVIENFCLRRIECSI